MRIAILINNCPKPKQLKRPSISKKDQQAVSIVLPYNEMLLSNKRGTNSCSHNDLHVSVLTGRSQSRSRGGTLCDCICVAARELLSVCQGLSVDKGLGHTGKERGWDCLLLRRKREHAYRRGGWPTPANGQWGDPSGPLEQLQTTPLKSQRWMSATQKHLPEEEKPSRCYPMGKPASLNPFHSVIREDQERRRGGGNYISKMAKQHPPPLCCSTA